MSLLIEFSSTLLVSLGEVLAWFNISRRKIEINIKNILLVVLLAALNIISYHYTNNFIKSVIILVIANVFCKIILNEGIKKCLIITFLCELIVIIIETILVMIAYNVFKVEMQESGNIYIAAIFDLIIAITIVLISKIGFINKIYLYLDRITSRIKGYYLFWLLLFIMFGTSAVFTSIYLKEEVMIVLIVNIMILFLYTIIVIFVFKYHNKYYNVSLKYNNTLENLQAQEAIINDYKIMNHENKNQLLTIKSIANNKKVDNYINSLIKQKTIFNNDILESTLKLPEGGIRGLIYSKMLVMKEDSIKCNLHVDKSIKVTILASIDDNDTVDICQILGVFIDNAIDEAKNISNKNINIDLNLTKDQLTIIISNYYDNKILMDKDNNLLKTTKGKNHGYGLQLVKRIINRNKHLSHETVITKDTFIQKLIINLKR